MFCFAASFPLRISLSGVLEYKYSIMLIKGEFKNYWQKCLCMIERTMNYHTDVLIHIGVTVSGLSFALWVPQSNE